MKIKITGKWVEVTKTNKRNFPGLLNALSNFDVKIGISQLSVYTETYQEKVVEFLIAYCKINNWVYEIEREPNYEDCSKELNLVLQKYKLNLLPRINGDNSLGLTLSPTDNWIEGKYQGSWFKGNEQN